MTYSENIARLQPSATMAVSALAKKLAAEGRDIIDLSAGEPDFDTPAWISEAAIAGIRGGKTRYTPASGLPELRKAVAQSLVARSAPGWHLAAENVVVSAGAKQALFNACFSVFGPGDEVLVGVPYWTSYPEMVSLARAEPVFVTGSEARGFSLTPAELDRVRTPATRGLMLCTPSNPSGAVYSLDELRAVAGWAKKHDIWLISDEIYRWIYFSDESGAAPGLLDLDPGDMGPFVLVDGVSKTFAMTGWRVGYSVSEAGLRRSDWRPPEPNDVERGHPLTDCGSRGAHRGRSGGERDRGDGRRLPAPPRPGGESRSRATPAPVLRRAARCVLPVPQGGGGVRERRPRVSGLVR